MAVVVSDTTPLHYLILAGQLALAKEIHADLVLLDDKVARRFAESEALKVKGTLGIVTDAAKAGWLDFRATVQALQRTTIYLEPRLAERLIAKYEKQTGKVPGE